MESIPVNTEPRADQSRREFLRRAAVGGVSLNAVGSLPATARSQVAEGRSNEKWYRRALRWGQTNINELDPTRYDIDWWKRHWKRTRVQGLVINAGGIISYYPSKQDLQYRAEHLGERDLYGELVRAAHAEGIFVLARMDSNRAHEDFYLAHPDWFAVNVDGKPYMADGRYISCIDSPYYDRYLPEVLREIIAWEKPEGFTDNSWSGLDRNQICYCSFSRASFRRATGHELPRKKDWDDPVYRQWIKWSYARRVEIWELNNRVCREAGGPNCLWIGMIGGDLVSQGRRFRDVKEICQRAEMIMLDDQGRSESIGFQGNAEIGKRLHGLLGWNKLIPESMAMYQRSPTFRKAAASSAEAKMWMVSGFAGTIQPWWHHVGAYQWDRRQFQTAVSVCQWHAANEKYLVNRRPIATVGVVYSQDNADFFGRDDAHELVARPYNGVVQALVRARIPYLPVHADQIDSDSGELSLLILPNFAAMSDDQVAAVRRFVQRGGGLLATGETSLYDQWGDRRNDFALADILGVHATGDHQGSTGDANTWGGIDHSYLRLLPPVGSDVDGPLSGDEPQVSAKRHPVLKGFDQTDIMAFGGWLQKVKVESGGIVPLTFIPSFPAYPPESSWMRQPYTDIPALVLQDRGAGRCAYLAADIDRRFARDNLPDHGELLANIIHWAVAGDVALHVDGKGLIDCHLYHQPGRHILHLVNLTSAGSWRAPVHELVPIGPLQLRLRMLDDVTGGRLQLRVSGGTASLQPQDGRVDFEIASLTDHELVVIE